MTNSELIAAEFQRRKRVLEESGYRIDQYGYEDLLIVEMSVKDEHTGKTLVRKQEGVAFRGRTPFWIECRKLMALERLANVVPQIWRARLSRGRAQKP